MKNRIYPKKKRVVLYMSAFPQLSETFLVAKFVGLLERGWDVHILCHQFNYNAWEHFPDLDDSPELKKKVHKTWLFKPRWIVPLLFIPGLFYCFLKSPGATLRYLRLGWRQLNWAMFKHFYLDIPLIVLNPDIIHFEFGSLAVGKVYLRDFLDTKLSVSFRGYDLNYIGLDKPDYYHNVWESVAGAHLLGQDLWQRAIKRGAPEDLIHQLIPPAVDLGSFPKPSPHRHGVLGTKDKPLRILSVGRLHWKKGYEFSLQAVRKIEDRGLKVELIIIGDGDYDAPLYFARHQLGLEANVTFLGSVPHPQVIEQLKWADIFLHGAVSEGFCNAVLEAQVIGVPVVCTDADGLRENVLDGVTGFIVPRRDPQVMAEKILLLAGDADLRRKMGAAGRKRVEDNFRMDQQLDAFEEFYDHL